MSGVRALPTEPLLDESTVGVDAWRQPGDVRRWIEELAAESDTNARCGKIAQSMRKQLDTPLFTSLGRGILVGAVRGDAEAIAALAGFLAVDGPGDGLIDRVYEFSNLHREAGQFRRRIDAGNVLEPGEKQVLDELTSVDRDLAKRYPAPEKGSGVRDRGPAWRCRKAYGELVRELRRTVRLEDDELDLFIRLSRLELTALELRASHLAGAINPYSARQVSQVMPILGTVDEDIRDMRRFLGQLEETRRTSLFNEQFSTLNSSLDDGDARRFHARLQSEEHLQLLWRLLRALDRTSVRQRNVAWFVDRVLDLGELLLAKGLRRRPLDLVAALLIVYDHYRDNEVVLHASAAVREAVQGEDVEGLSLVDGGLRLEIDPAAVRRLALPYGFPVPAKHEADAEETKEKEATVKDLVMSNINNTSVLLGLLKNQKVVNTPGVVRMVAERVRNMRVLDTICTSRNLHAGFANREVPLAILRSPMPIPIKTLRKFVNVRYVSKIDLRRLSRDKAMIRREVLDEVDAYLKSLT